MESSKKILDVVFKLNQEIFDQLDEGEYEELYPDLFTLTSDGKGDIVKFMNVPLWNSEFEERVFSVEAGDYEPLENFLRSKVNKLLTVIKKVQL